MHNATDDNAPAPLSAGYRVLRFFAIAMGLILIGGFVLICAFMAKQVKLNNTATASCEPLSIAIEENTTLLKAEEKDGKLMIWSNDPKAGLSLRQYDMCTGKILHDVRISGGLPAAQAAVPNTPN